MPSSSDRRGHAATRSPAAPERVFISIGSNAGDRAANCRRAVEVLEGAEEVALESVSPFYRTEPWGRTGQREFVNCAVEVHTALTPMGLLDYLKGVEERMGRTPPPPPPPPPQATPASRWGPRVIDLDIVFYGTSVVAEDRLTIPHPYAHERAFVLAPLADIAPDFIHPVLGKSVTDLLAELGADGVERIERDRP